MVADILGVVKLFEPDNNKVPPDPALYQSITPNPLDADKATVPAPHLELLVPAGTAGIALMVAVTAVLVADTQPVMVFLVSA